MTANLIHKSNLPPVYITKAGGCVCRFRQFCALFFRLFGVYRPFRILRLFGQHVEAEVVAGPFLLHTKITNPSGVKLVILWKENRVRSRIFLE